MRKHKGRVKSAIEPFLLSSPLLLVPPTTMYDRYDIPKDSSQPFTDYSRWRLNIDDAGNHTWQYLSEAEATATRPQNTIEKHWLGTLKVRFFRSLKIKY